MGFLDRMVADLISDSTGLPARRVVRRIGGRNILLLGGAALAGGLVADRMKKGNAGGVQATTPSSPSPVPPPPPPPPSTAVPPPPPPPPPAQAEPAETDGVPRELLFAIVRTLVAAALADGELDESERELIHRHLEASDLSEDQAARVRRELVVPAPPAELARGVAGRDEAEVLYEMAWMLLHADGELRTPEREWLDRLGAALDLDTPTRQRIESGP